MTRPVLAVPALVAIGALTLGAALPQDAAAPGAGAAAEAAPAYAIDPVHSCALFRVQHLGAGMFWGRFNEVTGTIAFDPENADGPSFDVSIPIASVDTGNGNLDAHLKTADFFDAESHEAMTFKSADATKTGEKTWSVKGDLTILGVTKPITASVEWIATAEGRQGTRTGFEARFDVKRSEWGMTYGVPQGALGDETNVIVAMEALLAP